MNPSLNLTSGFNNNEHQGAFYKNPNKLDDTELKINDLRNLQKREKIIAITAIALASVAIITLLALQLALPGAGVAAIIIPSIILAAAAVSSVVLIARILYRDHEIEKNKNKVIEDILSRNPITIPHEKKESIHPKEGDTDHKKRETLSKELDEIDDILSDLELFSANTSTTTQYHQPKIQATTPQKGYEPIPRPTPKVEEKTHFHNAFKDIFKPKELKAKDNEKKVLERVGVFASSVGVGYYNSIVNTTQKATNKKHLNKEIADIKEAVQNISANLVKLETKIQSKQEVLTPYQAAYLYSGLGSKSEISELLKNINRIVDKETGGETFLCALVNAQTRAEAYQLLSPLFDLKNIILKDSMSVSDRKYSLIDLLTLSNLFLSGWVISKNSDLNVILLEELSKKLKQPREIIIKNFLIEGNLLELISLSTSPWGAELVRDLLKYDKKSPPLNFSECCGNLQKNKKFAEQISTSFTENKAGSSHIESTQKKTDQFFYEIEALLPKNTLGLISLANNLNEITSMIELFFSKVHPDLSCLLTSIVRNAKLKEKIKVVLPKSADRMFEKLISILSLGVLRCGFLHKDSLNIIATAIGIDEKDLETKILNKELGKLILQ